MGRARTIGIAVIAVLAIGAVTAGAASAKTVLGVYDEGTLVPTGGQMSVYTDLGLGDCYGPDGHATLSTNLKGTDKVTNLFVGEDCLENNKDYETGTLTQITLSATGKATMKGLPTAPLEVHVYRIGPPFEEDVLCTYEFAAWHGAFTAGNTLASTYIEGTAVGKLDKTESAEGGLFCKAKESSEFVVELGYEGDGPTEAKTLQT